MFFRRFHDEVVVGHAPDFSGREPTPGQQAVRNRFKLAAIYGRTALANPVTKQLYENRADDMGIPIFAATIADFFNEPVVDEIDLSGYSGQAGGKIRIQAHDDFEVTGIGVRILDTTGATLEQGPATHPITGLPEWEYQATTTLPTSQAVTIEVTATDRPGHKATKMATKP